MAKKIWDDWEEIGDALKMGRKFVWSLVILAMLIAIFIPVMA
jgi:hypothetical protein